MLTTFKILLCQLAFSWSLLYHRRGYETSVTTIRHLGDVQVHHARGLAPYMTAATTCSMQHLSSTVLAV